MLSTRLSERHKQVRRLLHASGQDDRGSKQGFCGLSFLLQIPLMAAFTQGEIYRSKDRWDEVGPNAMAFLAFLINTFRMA